MEAFLLPFDFVKIPPQCSINQNAGTPALLCAATNGPAAVEKSRNQRQDYMARRIGEEAPLVFTVSWWLFGCSKPRSSRLAAHRSGVIG